MLTEKITKEELAFMEDWHKPTYLCECLFSDFDNLGHFDTEKRGSVRPYQLPMISQEAGLDFEAIKEHYKLNKKETFNLRKNIAEIYNLGGRLYGKSLMTLKLDIALSALYQDGLKGIFYSIDEKRIHGVLNPVERAMKYHPIYRMFDFYPKYKPEISFYGKKNQWELKGVNMALKGKNPGDQFYQLHVERMWGDEVSFETEEVYKKRRDSIAEIGCIFRLGGMTNFTRHSPIGQIFYDPETQDNIINLPRYVNPNWTNSDLEDALKEFGGQEAPNFKIFVEGEIIEDGVSEFDIDRVKRCYQPRKRIKRFELKKEQFSNFQNLLVVERPANAERLFIACDIGESSGTDIVIVSEVANQYRYLYNIVAYNFTRKEQLALLKWLIEKTQANVVGLDCGDAMGRNLADDLEELYPKENIVRYAGTTRIKVGFEKDEKGNIKIVKGQPVYREEKMKEWSVRRLKALLYEERFAIPVDYKFDSQINSVISTKSGDHKIYACISETGDHLFDAFRVLAICIWLKKDFNSTPRMASDWGTGVSSWKRNKKEK